MSVNGSSSTGNCCNGTNRTCSKPNSSVLFDGHVPTLTGLDGDMWAGQLLTIQTTQSVTNVIFDFTDTPGYDRIERVEVVMFNCPQLIASTTIILTGATARDQSFNTFDSTSVSSLTSCESLVRVCLSSTVSQPLIGLQFTLDQDSDWVYLAEVTFYARGTTCPPNAILNQTSSDITSPPPPACTTPPPDTTPPAEQSDADTTSSQVTILTSVGTSTQDKTTTTIIAVVIPLSIILIIVIIVVLILCIVCTTKHKRAKEDHTTTHRQTHNHQPPQDREHFNLCEETGQAYYSSLHDIQGEDVPADQVYNRLERDTGPVRGGAKSSRGATVDQNETEVGAYSTVSYNKQPQVSKEAGVEGMEDPFSQLYAQVNEDIKKPIKKSEDIFATDEQEEASASALYAQVEEKRKKKKKKKEDIPPHKPDQLYAQVDKKKRKKREKEEIKEVLPQESGDVYSVVNKPSAPPVPLKSDLLMEELQ